MRPSPARRLRRTRVAGTAVALALGAALVLGAGLAIPNTAGAGSISDADAEIAALREQADQVLKTYLDALTTASALEVQIAEIEARLPGLSERRRELRVIARQRAVEAYKRSGVELGAIIGATNVLSAMRRSHWLNQLNARDHATFDELAVVTEKLEAQRGQIQQARQEQQVALDELLARGRDIDAKLQAAEDRARQLRAVPPRPVNPKGTGDAPPPAPIDYVPTPGTMRNTRILRSSASADASRTAAMRTATGSTTAATARTTRQAHTSVRTSSCNPLGTERRTGPDALSSSECHPTPRASTTRTTWRGRSSSVPAAAHGVVPAVSRSRSAASLA